MMTVASITTAKIAKFGGPCSQVWWPLYQKTTLLNENLSNDGKYGPYNLHYNLMLFFACQKDA